MPASASRSQTGGGALCSARRSFGEGHRCRGAVAVRRLFRPVSAATRSQPRIRDRRPPATPEVVGKGAGRLGRLIAALPTQRIFGNLLATSSSEDHDDAPIKSPSDIGAGSAGAPVLSDSELVERVRAGDAAAFELIMRRHNRRLFRLARSILRSGAEAEDVVQETYVRAFAKPRLSSSARTASRPGSRGLPRTRRWAGYAAGSAWSRSTTTSGARKMPMSAVSRR